jgi:hypothetical protein
MPKMLVLLLGLYAFAVQSQSQTPAVLADVHTIFVDTLGTGEASGLIRDKIINRLVASKRFEVVLGPDKADAILTGSVEEAQSVRFNQGTGGTRFSANAAVRLITKDQRILWTFEGKNRAFSRSASSSVADHVVKELLKAAAPPKTK